MTDMETFVSMAQHLPTALLPLPSHQPSKLGGRLDATWGRSYCTVLAYLAGNQGFPRNSENYSFIQKYNNTVDQVKQKLMQGSDNVSCGKLGASLSKTRFCYCKTSLTRVFLKFLHRMHAVISYLIVIHDLSTVKSTIVVKELITIAASCLSLPTFKLRNIAQLTTPSTL